MVRKNIIKKGLVSLMLLAILPQCGGKEAVKEEVIARVTLLVGNMDIKRLGKSAVPAVLGDTVTDGDIIKTGNRAYAAVQIGDRSIIRIGPDSRVEVKNILSLHTTEIYLEKGEVLSKVSRLSKGDLYKIVTPTATAGVRGTEFLVSVDKKKEKIAVREGSVSVSIDKATADAAEKESVIEAGNAEILKISTAKDGSRSVSVDIRPMTGNEQIKAGAASAIPILPDLNSVSREELDKNQQEIIRTDETDSGPGSNDIEKVEKNKARAARIKKLIKQKPKTLEEIRVVFERIDEVSLYSGKVIKGAIISRGAEYSILTTSGVVKVPQEEVRSVKVIK